MQAASVGLGDLGGPLIERYLAGRRAGGLGAMKALQPLLDDLAPLGVSASSRLRFNELGVAERQIRQAGSGAPMISRMRSMRSAGSGPYRAAPMFSSTWATVRNPGTGSVAGL